MPVENVAEDSNGLLFGTYLKSGVGVEVESGMSVWQMWIHATVSYLRRFGGGDTERGIVTMLSPVF